MARVVVWSNYNRRLRWLPFGGLASLDYGNGYALALVHDLDYRATGRTVSGVAGTVQDLAYTFDAASTPRTPRECFGRRQWITKRFLRFNNFLDRLLNSLR